MAASADQLPDLITIVAVWHNIDCWKNSISLVKGRVKVPDLRSCIIRIYCNPDTMTIRRSSFGEKV